jgi:NitT/TauT family transport system substrate-binding protein
MRFGWVALDRKFDGPATPFLIARDRGYYHAEGLDVTVEAGNGALDPITRVASGSHELGFADINAFLKHRDQNPNTPVKAVFMLYNRPPFAIVARKSRGVTVPADLEGKRLGAPAADAATAHWPLFARLTGIDAAKVTVDNVGVPVREPMLAAGQVDAITGLSFSAYINLKDRGVAPDDIVMMMMADHGLTLYGHAILVHSKFAAEKGPALQAFLRAFVRGLKDTVRDPASTIEALLQRDETARKELEVERLRMAIRSHILTPEVRELGYGAIDPERMAEAIEQIELTYKFKAKPTVADAFDASFLPPLDQRRAN